MSKDDEFSYRNYIHDIAAKDAHELIRKDKEYGGSWKKRGGIGAYFATIRKVDRIEEQVSKHGYDVFQAMEVDPRKEGILDDIRDLRRYLMLWEAHLMAERARSKSLYQPSPKCADTTADTAEAAPKKYPWRCAFANEGDMKCDRPKCSHCNGERG